MKSILNSSSETKKKVFFARWGIREWSMWPLLPLLGLGLVVCLITSGVLEEWSITFGWMVASAFALISSFIQYWAQTPVSTPFYKKSRRRTYLFWVASAFSFRWILLGVSLFLAVLNDQVLSVPATASCILVPSLLFMGSSFALYFKEQARRKGNV